MKTVLWIAGVVAGLVILVLLALAIFVRVYFTSGKLKAMVIPKLEQMTGRQVSIDRIKISLFKGVDVSGFALKEADGKTDFIKARKFLLNYSLPPLLKRELVITRLELVSPFIRIERLKDGKYNFTDIKEKMAREREEKEKQKQKIPAAEEAGKKKFAVALSGVRVRDAKAVFVDDLGKIPDIDLLADASLDVSQAAGGKLKPSGSIDLKEMKAVIGQKATVNTTGRIRIGKEIDLDLLTGIEGDRIKTTGVIRNYEESPDANIDVSSLVLHLDRLAALMPKGKAAPAAKQAVHREAAAPQKKMKAKGRVNVKTAYYQGFTITGFNLLYRYENGVAGIAPVSMDISGGKKVDVAGNFKGAFSFNTNLGVKPTLKGSGTAVFPKIAVKQSTIADQISSLLGVPELRTPVFTSSRMRFEIAKEKVTFAGFMNSARIEFANLNGAVGFDKRLKASLDVKLSPALAAGISRSRYMKFLTDQRGWTTVPVKISGVVDRPSAGLSTAPIIQKGIGRGLEELEKKFFK